MEGSENIDEVVTSYFRSCIKIIKGTVTADGADSVVVEDAIIENIDAVVTSFFRSHIMHRKYII